jgi:hypothetical protein
MAHDVRFLGVIASLMLLAPGSSAEPLAGSRQPTAFVAAPAAPAARNASTKPAPRRPAVRARQQQKAKTAPKTEPSSGRDQAASLARTTPAAGAPAPRSAGFGFENRPSAPSSGLGAVFEELNRLGIMARGHAEDPSWYNPRGSIGAIIGIQKRF